MRRVARRVTASVLAHVGTAATATSHSVTFAPSMMTRHVQCRSAMSSRRTGASSPYEIVDDSIFAQPDVHQRCVVVFGLPVNMLGTEIRAWIMRVLGEASDLRDALPHETPEEAARNPFGDAQDDTEAEAASGESEVGAADPELDAVRAAADSSRRIIERVFIPLSPKKRRPRPIAYVLFRDASTARRFLASSARDAAQLLQSSASRVRGELAFAKLKPFAQSKTRAEAEFEDMQRTLATLELDRVLLNPNLLFDIQRKHQRRHVLQRHAVRPVFVPPPVDDDEPNAVEAADDSERARGELRQMRDAEALLRPKRSNLV